MKDNIINDMLKNNNLYANIIGTPFDAPLLDFIESKINDDAFFVFYVYSQKPSQCLLLISINFLKQFSKKPPFFVAKEILSISWGVNDLNITKDRDFIINSGRISRKSRMKLIKTDEIGNIAGEIKNAKESLEKTTHTIISPFNRNFPDTEKNKIIDFIKKCFHKLIKTGG